MYPILSSFHVIYFFFLFLSVSGFDNSELCQCSRFMTVWQWSKHLSIHSFHRVPIQIFRKKEKKKRKRNRWAHGNKYLLLTFISVKTIVAFTSPANRSIYGFRKFLCFFVVGGFFSLKNLKDEHKKCWRTQPNKFQAYWIGEIEWITL